MKGEHTLCYISLDHVEERYLRRKSVRDYKSGISICDAWRRVK